MLSRSKFEEIIFASSHSAHKSLKNGKNSLTINGKIPKKGKRKKLTDIIQKISDERKEFKQVNHGREHIYLNTVEDDDEDIILVEPTETEKELDILITFGSIRLKDDNLIRSIKETLNENDTDLTDIFESSLSSFVEVYAYSSNNP